MRFLDEIAEDFKECESAGPLLRNSKQYEQYIGAEIRESLPKPRQIGS
jgi:hypothetical protein